ncbi:MAG: NTP transferase domain-containing protein [Sphingomicrobium sp.]
MSELRWSAMLLAGSRPRSDQDASLMMGHKTLLQVGGVAMVLRPLKALLDSPAIDRVTVVTQDIAALQAVLPKESRVTLDRSEATIAATIADSIGRGDLHYPALVTTADHALLDPAMIAEFTTAAAGADLAIGVVEEGNLLARFPGSKRTWLGFKGGRYSGANLFAFGSDHVLGAIEHWREVEQNRKKGWRVLAALGPALLLGAVFKLRTIQQSADAVGRKLGMTIRIVVLTDPKAAIDVDKPADHVLVEAILRGEA